MTDNDWRNAMIEDAGRAILKAHSDHPQPGEYGFDNDAVAWAEALAASALAVFEKAHTPTDDEREALVAILEAPLTEESQGRTFSEMLADVIRVRFGFRRSEAPEPSAFAEMIESSSLGTPEAQALRATVSNEKAAALVAEAHRRSEIPEQRSCSDVHPTTAHLLPHAEPQGEPSDAQVAAAMREASRRSLMWRTSSDVKAVLRAAFAVGEGGVQ